MFIEHPFNNRMVSICRSTLFAIVSIPSWTFTFSIYALCMIFFLCI